MLAASARPALNKTGTLLLLKIGMVIKIAPTRKKMKKNTCNWGNGIENDIILKHRSYLSGLQPALSNVGHNVIQ
jgi:hypothetical protein